ncbi:hypothetical protein DEJ48_12510 [Streptomyces venezuelae]|uniref:Uncharacterized protein n=1 Tax=Streptomyces venezuelae TaxID=54571 RepID=A0A5P2BWM1_STRVZ|nr:hypothetical protein DEJ48_12510 [Streptomyces venezuelae]
MTTQHSESCDSPQNQPTPPPFLSLHTAVVLLTALVIGLVMGSLSVFAGGSVAAAVIAGLASAGTSVPVLRTLIR